MEGWGRFAEAAGFDLFEAIDAIRMRPTHSNMRQPGFGVGGYCLTKDPLFAEFGARELLGFQQLEFPFSERALEVNDVMPLVTLDRVEQLLGGLEGRRILLLGVSYREGVADTRESPAATFVAQAKKRGADVVAQDPLVSDLGEGQADRVVAELPDPDGFDAVVFAVPHSQYAELDLPDWFGEAKPLVVDASRVLDAEKLRELAGSGLRVGASGGGEIAA
jgi:UDP-N-acetyl-D-mannosaminuronate dehydrogenase